MGEVIGAGELHKGVKLLIDGEPWEITEFSFSKPGKGQMDVDSAGVLHVAFDDVPGENRHALTGVVCSLRA